MLALIATLSASHAQQHTACASVDSGGDLSRLISRLQRDASGYLITFEGGQHLGTFEVPRPANFSSLERAAQAIVSSCPGCGLTVSYEGGYAHIIEPGTVMEHLMDASVQVPAGEHRLAEVVDLLSEQWTRALPGETARLTSGAHSGLRVLVPDHVGGRPVQVRALLRELEVLRPGWREGVSPYRLVWRVSENSLDQRGGVVHMVSTIPSETSMRDRIASIDARIAELQRPRSYDHITDEVIRSATEETEQLELRSLQRRRRDLLSCAWASE